MGEELRGDLSGLPETGQIVVGFSGGADSTALAHWLREKTEPGRILLAHVNHMLRGEEADRDEAAAQAFAQRLGLRFTVFRADVGELARQRGLGLEECGRQVRYEFFQSLAAGENDRILTAHTADDNAETLLLHLCRGTGLSGLCGIPRQRGKILRPLLGVTRREIEAYCKAHSLSYVTDSTNLSGEFARNRLRREVLPVLKELNPEFLRAAAGTAELLTKDRDFLRKEAEKLLGRARRPYGLDAALLREAHESPRRAALRLWLEKEGCKSPEKRHLEEIDACLARGGAAVLPGNVKICCAGGLLYRAASGEPEGFSLNVELPEDVKKIPLPGGKVLILEKKQVFTEKSTQKIHNLYFKNALDYDIITGVLTVRTRREGDLFFPAGRGVSKSLKQVFRETGLPADRRGGAVLLECGGTLAFCEGAGASEEFRVTERTSRVLLVTVVGNEENGQGENLW